MAKRERDPFIAFIEEEIRRSHIGPVLSEEEIEKEAKMIDNLLEKKLDSLYNTFIQSIKVSRYGPFMIQGEMGKIRQEYYKPFYENLIKKGFITHFLTMTQFAKIGDSNDFHAFMEDIFPKIYKDVVIDKVYLGHYITHTNTFCVQTDEHIFIIKNNDNAYDNKRLLLTYPIDNDSFYLAGATFVDRNIEIVTVECCDRIGAGSLTVICLDFNNNLYNVSFDVNNKPKLEVIPFMLNNDAILVKYKEAGIVIKALYRSLNTFFLLTSNGNVYVMGVVNIGMINITKLRKTYGINGDNVHFKNIVSNQIMLYFFTPIMFDTLIPPNIVSISFEGTEDEKIVLYDFNNIVYVSPSTISPFQIKHQLSHESYLTGHRIHSYDLSWLMEMDIEEYERKKAIKYPLILDCSSVGPYQIDVDKNITTVGLDLYLVPVSASDFISSKSEINASRYSKSEIFTYRDSENEVLSFYVDKNSSVYVLLSNQKIYKFEKEMFGVDYQLRQLILNYPIIWDSTKKDKRDTWIFQCYYCQKYEGVKLQKDHSINGVFCTTDCQKNFYYTQHQRLLTLK
jgi:hypothetical protein